MSATYIKDLPSVNFVSLDDILIMEKTTQAGTVTYKVTVRQVLESMTPKPSITEVKYIDANKELEIQGTDILPTTLIEIDGTPYLISSYDSKSVTTIKVSINSGLTVGAYNVKLSNGINETTAEFKVN